MGRIADLPWPHWACCPLGCQQDPPDFLGLRRSHGAYHIRMQTNLCCPNMLPQQWPFQWGRLWPKHCHLRFQTLAFRKSVLPGPVEHHLRKQGSFPRICELCRATARFRTQNRGKQQQNAHVAKNIWGIFTMNFHQFGDFHKWGYQWMVHFMEDPTGRYHGIPHFFSEIAQCYESWDVTKLHVEESKGNYSPGFLYMIYDVYI